MYGETYVVIGTGTQHNKDGELVDLSPARYTAKITSDVYGGGNKANVTGDSHVMICAKEVTEDDAKVWKPFAEATDSVRIQGTALHGVFGGGNLGNVLKNSYVILGGGSVHQSVYGGGCDADVKGNTSVTMLDGYVFDGVCGGGLSGSVGTFTMSTNTADVNIFGHTSHDGCTGKPVSCTEGTGTCTIKITGGQVGPVEVATQGMNRITAGKGDPIAEGWVWGAGRGVVEDPATHPDTHFKTYVNKTDVTIGGSAFIMEGVIGGGEFGRVLGNTHLTIQDSCQVGVGEGSAEILSGTGTELDPYVYGKPLAYTPAQWRAAEAAVAAGDTTAIKTLAAAMPECSHYPYGRNIGTEVSPRWVYETYDPYYDKYYDETEGTLKDNIPDSYKGASTSAPSDGKSWIGSVFGGGSGYFPYEKAGNTGYGWVRSAGWVEGDALLEIKGGHILTNVYGGNEYSDVKGKCTVRMTGGTVGVPRTLAQIAAHPVSCYLFGAGKGDPRSVFDDMTNVGSVEVEVSGGTIFGSVFGGSEDGHVLGDVTMKISGGHIGTWGTSYVDGNIFGGGRGFTGMNTISGSVGGNVTMRISGGKMLGSIYGGGRLGSVGIEMTGANAGKMKADTESATYGHVTIDISDGTIGNDYEYHYLTPPTGSEEALATLKADNHIPQAGMV